MKAAPGTLGHRGAVECARRTRVSIIAVGDVRHHALARDADDRRAHAARGVALPHRRDQGARPLPLGAWPSPTWRVALSHLALSRSGAVPLGRCPFSELPCPRGFRKRAGCRCHDAFIRPAAASRTLSRARTYPKHTSRARAHAQVDFSRASVNITLPGSLRRCACPT